MHMHAMHKYEFLLVALALVSCGDGSGNPFNGDDTTGGTAGSTTMPSPSGTATSAADSTGEEPDGSGGPIKLDVSPTDVPPVTGDPVCEVVDDMNGVGDCSNEAPSDSFAPEVQWSWQGNGTAVSPLVINFTDDDDNGVIDLCDTPDIIVVNGNRIVVLDGATGAEHMTIQTPVNGFVTPAVGDIDGDARPEIVTGYSLGLFNLGLIAFEDDGSIKWMTKALWPHDQGGAVGLADFDNDGSPEAYADGAIVAADGTVMFVAPAQTGWGIAQRNTASVAADLDGDQDLELILGQSAYHHDGTPYYSDLSILPGYPQVANLDNDPEPEILINNNGGITILEHDGSIKIQDARPTGDVGIGAWFRPSTIHDFDDDGLSEFAVSSAANYSVYFRNVTVMWSAPVQDGSGWAAGTAFDFLGDGGAEAMYADETNLFVFDETGTPVLTVPRSSKTLIEYPVVADVDNDSSAEIVVVSSAGWDDIQTSPTVQVIRDMDDRWIQARRIWNQHTYHVTNIREDGHIPQFEAPSWELLNTYRTNAQIENGSVCTPPVG
jgi:hypothetical protein